MFRNIAQCSELKLRKLNFEYHKNFQSVNPELLASALCRVEHVVPSMACLSDDQLSALFRKINECSELRLKKLNLKDTFYTPIAPSDLASAICKLEEVNMSDKDDRDMTITDDQ